MDTGARPYIRMCVYFRACSIYSNVCKVPRSFLHSAFFFKVYFDLQFLGLFMESVQRQTLQNLSFSEKKEDISLADYVCC